MTKKISYLFLALLLPALIFVFLKFFGKNEFDIPVYYEDGITAEAAAECSRSGQGQYVVQDPKVNWPWRDGYSVIVSIASEKDTNDVRQLMADEKLERLKLISLPAEETEVKKCVLFLKEPWNAVLIDSQKRIRGYYKLGNREEMDRLEVELKILLKKY